MEVIGKKIILKIRAKKKGNIKLLRAVDQLIKELESLQIASFDDLKGIKGHFEKVHNDGFYFVDLHIHRALLLIKISENEAKVIWVGDHDEYVRTFKNNKNSIEKWLKSNNLLQ